MGRLGVAFPFLTVLLVVCSLLLSLSELEIASNLFFVDTVAAAVWFFLFLCLYD